MAAAKALLAAAGLLHSTATEHAAKPNTSTATEHAAKLPKTSTATEHATSASQLDTAASTKDVPRWPLLYRLPMSTSKPRASASEDDFPSGDSDLGKIVALLLWTTQKFQSNIHKDDIHHAVLEMIVKHSEAATGGAPGLLHTASAAKLSELIDIMTLHKDGSPKDPNETLEFMRRIAKIREEMETRSDNATERVELAEDSVLLCYRRFGRTLLTHDLLPHQMNDQRYRLQNNFDGDTHLSSYQRSFTDSMLCRFLGDKKIAFRIWQHGLPSVADPPLVYRRRHRLDIGMLQSGLDECLRWYSRLANVIVVHQTQTGFEDQHSASSLDEQQRQWQQRCREAPQKARDALHIRAALAKQMHGGKRSYDDMNDSEQKMLERDQPDDDFLREDSDSERATDLHPVDDAHDNQIPESPIPAIAALEAGNHVEAEGHVFQNHQARGYELEEHALSAKASFEQALASREERCKLKCNATEHASSCAIASKQKG